MVGRRHGSSLHRFHFFDGLFPGQWYPAGFLSKSMILKKIFTQNLNQFLN